MVFDIENEQNLLAGLLKHPETFSEIETIISELDFEDKGNHHKAIFSVLKRASLEDRSKDLVSVSDELKGISLIGEFDYYGYLESLTYKSISEKGTIEAARKLGCVSVRRAIAETCSNIIQKMKMGKFSNIGDILAISDEMYGKVTKSFTSINEPEDIYEDLKEYIEGVGNEDDDENIEIECPYSIYQKMYGGFYPEDLVIYMARYKAGKSVWVMNMLAGIAENEMRKGRVIKELYLDSEMTKKEVQRRLMSKLTGINEAHFKNNSWRKNHEFVQLVRAAWPYVEKMTGSLHHLYIGNQTTEVMVSHARRWHYKNIRAVNVGKPKKEQTKAIGCLDYFKLTEKDGVDNAYFGSMMLGYRVDAFKKLAPELQMPWISCCQTNANDEAGLSREMAKFASSVFRLKVKEEEDITLEGGEATHYLEPEATRGQGIEAEGFNNLVKVPAGKGRFEYKKNHINYKFDKFKFTEIDTLRQRIALLDHDDGKQKKHKVEDDDF